MLTRRKFLGATTAVFVSACRPKVALGSMQPARQSTYVVGINITGPEIRDVGHPMRDVYQHGYTYPQNIEVLRRFYDLGVRVVQLPFKIERVWPDFGKPLNQDELYLIKQTAEIAASVGLMVFPSPHNGGHYEVNMQEQPLGSHYWPVEAFGMFWELLVWELKDLPGLFGYSLETEPHDLEPDVWPKAAQLAVNEIRKVDMRSLVTIPGNRWSNSQYWPQFNGELAITDPGHNLAYEATCYGDVPFAGFYQDSYETQASLPSDDANRARPNILVDRVQPFVEWLQRYGHRGIVTEWGIPNTPPWLVAGDHFLRYLEANQVGTFIWNWGPWSEQVKIYVDPWGQSAELLGTYAQRAL